MVHFWYKLCSEIVTVTEPSSTYAGAAPRNHAAAAPCPRDKQTGRQADGQSAVQTEYRWTENSSRRADCLRVHGRPAYPRRDKDLTSHEGVLGPGKHGPHLP